MEKNRVSRIQSAMKKPSKAKRQWGLMLVQIGLSVIFFAGPGGNTETLGVVLIAVAYVLYVVGCALFCIGAGERFFEDRGHRVLVLTVLIGVAVCVSVGVSVTGLFKGISHDAQICTVFVSQSVALLLAWVGEEIWFSKRKENLGRTAKK